MRETTRRKRGAALNTIDRVVSYFNPVAGARRLQARMMLSAFGGTGGYESGSKKKRSLSSWLPGGGSADADQLPDLPTLRGRSRDLVRNGGIGGGAINTVCTKVVGTGLSLHASIHRDILGLTKEDARAWQKKTESEFRMWAETKACDITGQQDFYGLQDLALRSSLESGDLFGVLRDKPGRDPYELAVQLVEADRAINKDHKPDSQQLAAGIRIDEFGEPVEYHFLKQHPNDLRYSKREWEVVPAYGENSGRRHVIHLFTKLRPGQRRGVPYLAPVIEEIKQIGRFTEAEIDAAVLNSFFAAFIKTEGEGMNPLESATSGKTPGTGGDQAAGNWDGKLSSGLITELNPNESMEFADPNRPNSQFETFMTFMLRQVGMAIEVPYEVLIKHFQSSYTAARGSLLEAWHFFRKRRSWLATDFCQPIYEEFLAEAVAKGRIDAPGFFEDPIRRWAWSQAEWVGDGPGSVDPYKEEQAREKRLSNRVSTLQKECMQLDGSDWEDNMEQQSTERDAYEREGLAMPGASDGNNNGPADDPDDDPQRRLPDED